MFKYYYNLIFVVITIAITFYFIPTLLPIKIFGCLILLIIALLFSKLIKKYSRQKKKFKKGLVTFLNIILIIGMIISNVLVIKLSSTVGTISSGYSIHKTSFVVLKDSPLNDVKDITNDTTVGVLREGNIEGYDLAVSYFKKHKQSPQLKDYLYYGKSAQALLHSEIDVMVVNDINNPDITDSYPDFSDHVKVIGETSKLVKNEKVDVQVKKDPFSILIGGIDTRTGNIDTNTRTDAIMVVTINPKTMQVSMLSIPRDTYMPVVCENGMKDKITHSGNQGIECTRDSVAEYLGIDIPYYVKADFQSLIKIVDTIGGITVDVPKAFCEQNSRGKKNAICLEAGVQELDGEQALAFSRHRKTTSDVVRGENQQKVIEAIINKVVTSMNISDMNELINISADSIRTNMPTKDIFNLADVVFTNYKDLNITNIKLDGTGSTECFEYYGFCAYATITDEASLDEAKQKINNVIEGILPE